MHRKNACLILACLITLMLSGLSCKKEDRVSKMAAILEFGIPSLQKPFYVDHINDILLNVDSIPYTVDRSALVATFKTVPGAVVRVGKVVQESGVTVNDFRGPVVYSVTAADGKTTVNFTIRILTTIDPQGIFWSLLSGDGVGSYHSIVSAASNTYVMAAANTQNTAFGLFYSANAVTWGNRKVADADKDSIPSTEHGKMLYFQDAFWLMGGLRKDGVTNKIWTSRNDGEKWDLAAGAATRWSARERLNAVVFDGAMWVIGGNEQPAGNSTTVPGNPLNDVWKSTDGITWTRVTAAAAFPARTHPAVFVFQNKIWVAGGKDASGYLNDIWNSADGATWTKVAATTPPPLRAGHQIMVNKAELLLIGGENANGIQKELWVSADNGITWQQITFRYDVRVLPENFPARAYFDMPVIGRSYYIIGGLGLTDKGAIQPVKAVWRGLVN
ncbi:Kelch repeat-containing protein [Chitinophaga lutea]